MTEAYRSILHHSRPVSSHPRMTLENRAKLFTPFAALRGFDIALLTKNQERLLVPRAPLCEEEKERLNETLAGLRPGERIAVTYFFPVRQTGEQDLGEYAVETSAFRCIDREAQLLLLESRTILLENIREIRFLDPEGRRPL